MQKIRSTDALAGWACPDCGNTESFEVSVTVRGTVTVTDKGFACADINDGEGYWEDDDWAQCEGCLNEADVAYFTTGGN